MPHRRCGHSVLESSYFFRAGIIIVADQRRLVVRPEGYCVTETTRDATGSRFHTITPGEYSVIRDHVGGIGWWKSHNLFVALRPCRVFIGKIPFSRADPALTRGEDVTGHITELDEFHVCVDLGQRVVTIFEDILAGWEIHHHDGARGNDASNIIRENNGITAQIDDTSHRSTEPHLVTDGVSPETAAAVLARRTRIEAAISEGIKHARLEFPDPDSPPWITRSRTRKLRVAVM